MIFLFTTWCKLAEDKYITVDGTKVLLFIVHMNCHLCIYCKGACSMVFSHKYESSRQHFCALKHFFTLRHNLLAMTIFRMNSAKIPSVSVISMEAVDTFFAL